MQDRACHARTGVHKLRFTRVQLENWRNFTRVDVSLQRRAFLVGPNASGKSNFLDVFRFLHDIVAVGGGFQEAVGLRGGVSRIRSLTARHEPDVTVGVAIGDDEPSAWSYELEFGQDGQGRPLIKREVVARASRVEFERPDGQDQEDPERLTQTYVEQVHANRAFREIAELFDSVRYLHIVPNLIRSPERSRGLHTNSFGGDFLDQIAQTPENTRRARLRRIRDALRVAVPQLTELEFQRDLRGAPHLRGKYEHWRAKSAWQSEDQFSDGTLRLMGLLWSVLDGTGPLLLEEPELSLHPEVIRYIPQMMARVQRRSGRQILVSTHSPDLLNDPGLGLDEVLMLQPGNEGTTVRLASEDREVRVLLDGGIPLPEIITPRTGPKDARQVALFGSS